MQKNSRQYWDARFATGSWEANCGRKQSSIFAREQLALLNLTADYSGVVVDFGCGGGDAFEAYRMALPRASLIGIDHSLAAISAAKARYGALGTFWVGDEKCVPPAGIVIASNVLEHLAEPLAVARTLRERAEELVIVVPYREHLQPNSEHRHSFREDSFKSIGTSSCHVYVSRGWSEFGLRNRWWNIYMKNPIRVATGRRWVRRNRQIMYRFALNGGGRAEGRRAEGQLLATQELPVLEGTPQRRVP
jgi:SAM-dependent methyltransferase